MKPKKVGISPSNAYAYVRFGSLTVGVSDLVLRLLRFGNVAQASAIGFGVRIWVVGAEGKSKVQDDSSN